MIVTITFINDTDIIHHTVTIQIKVVDRAGFDIQFLFKVFYTGRRFEKIKHSI